MSRPLHHLYAPHLNAQATQAASLIWARTHQGPDQPPHLEVLLTKRSEEASFAPGAYVFPGGKIDPADEIHAKAYLAVHPNCKWTPAQASQICAALRESFEELGLVLVQDESGARMPSAQIEQLARHEDLYTQLSRLKWTLCIESVHLLCHWITDRDLPIRFDVPFFVAACPDDLHPSADEKEQFDPIWISPPLALQRHHAEQLHLVYPTIKTLERLHSMHSAHALLDATKDQEPWFSSCARAGFLGGMKHRYMEHESAFGELALVCPEGQVQHHLDWQSERAVALLKNVSRLTAPNPGLMTGPGTNTYIVGTAQSGFIVIDPGPATAEHLERLCRTTSGDIRHIICTHSHADHSPGAKPLQAMCNTSSPIIWGLPSAPTARANSVFVPDQPCTDGQTFVLQDEGSNISHTLRVVFTPGHAANHICLTLEEEGLLFSGDHILNGSTTVVDPPDGNMNAYLASLDRLRAICVTEKIEFILPAHGHVMGNTFGAPYDPVHLIDKLKAHRLKREAKIKEVLHLDPKGDLSTWVKRAYDDVPERVWPAALRSLSAHVERLVETGLAFELSLKAQEQLKHPSKVLEL